MVLQCPRQLSYFNVLTEEAAVSLLFKLAAITNAIVATGIAVYLCACGTPEDTGASPPVAVLSAFPAEVAPLLEQAIIDDTLVLDGRVLRVGTLAGVPVVLAVTGIGLANAAATTRAVLARFAVSGVVVSGVAGSPLRIGDVTVPLAWTLGDGAIYTAHREWIDLADKIALSGSTALERCAIVQAASVDEPVCLLHEPAIMVGGVGRSSDPFGDTPFPCQPDGGDVFGCDVASDGTASGSEGSRLATRAAAAVNPEAPVVTDMETAAIAREAAARGVPFIAFRAVSDGAGDPLGLPGFPAQFFAYYRLAAHNAAAVTVAFLERLAAVTCQQAARHAVGLPAQRE